MFSRLAKHAAWLLLARLWTHLAMALFTILVARQLGGSGFGEYAFMAALIVIGNMLATFGSDMYLIRAIAAGGRLGQLPAALVLQLGLSALLVASVFLASPLLTFQSVPGAAALRIYSLSLFPLAFFTVFTTALRGEQQMGAYALLNASSASMQALLAAVLYLRAGDLILLAWLLLLAQVVAALLAAFLCARKIPQFWMGWGFSIPALFGLVRASAPLALLSILTIVYQRLVPTLLPFLAGALQTGLFSAAARLVELAKVGHVAAFTAIYPLMAQSREKNAAWFAAFRPSWLVLLGVAALGSLALFLLAGPLVVLLFGQAYGEAVPALRILAWVLLPYTLNMFLSLAFLANGDEAIVTGALAAGLLALAVLTAQWGQAAGPPGAAWAVLSAESLQSTILLYQAARRLRVVAAKPGGVREFPDLS